MIQIGGVYTTFCQEKGILLQKYRDRNGRCIAILFKSIGVRGRCDSPEKWGKAMRHTTRRLLPFRQRQAKQGSLQSGSSEAASKSSLVDADENDNHDEEPALQSCRAATQRKNGPNTKNRKSVENSPRSKMGKKWPKNTKKGRLGSFLLFFGVFQPFFPIFDRGE